MTDYERGPQQLWADPKPELFTEKINPNGKASSFLSWSQFRKLVLGVGSAIGVVCGIAGGSFFYILAGAVVGGALGYFLPVPFKECYKASLYRWFYLAILYIIPPVVIWLLPLAAGAIKIVLLIAVVLLVLSLFGS